MIKIDFTKTHETYGVYADAIHLEENHTYTDADIEAMKQQRFDNWVSHIVTMSNQPPVEITPPVDPTVIDVEPK